EDAKPDLVRDAFLYWERQIDAELRDVQRAVNVEAALRPRTRDWFGQLVDATSLRAPERPDNTTTGYWVDVPLRQRVLVSLLKNVGFELLIRDERVVRYLRRGALML